MGGVTYAQETITETLQGKDGTTYYVVAGGDDRTRCNCRAGISQQSLGQSLIVRYDFTGMVLTAGSFD